MKKMGLILFILLLLNPLYTRQASALSCAVMYTIPEAYQKYDGVVIGRVESIRETRKNNKVTLTITRSFKGITQDSLIIVDDKTWGALSRPGAIHEEYLIFLNYKEGLGWENPLCSPMKKVTDLTGDESAFLDGRELELADPEGSGLVKGLLSQDQKIHILWGSVIALTILGIIGCYLWIRRRRR